MSELNVKIVRLEPMRVASTQGFGQGPEEQATNKMHAWLTKKGWINDLQAHRFFGFNNPDPSPGSPNYGYELWVTVGKDVEPDEDVRIKDFHGGLYAVTHCKLPVITDTWKKLIVWREGSGYKPATHQWLEECQNQFAAFEDMEFDIYLPIAE
jgi:AraC family transcriptional regulator